VVIGSGDQRSAKMESMWLFAQAGPKWYMIPVPFTGKSVHIVVAAGAACLMVFLILAVAVMLVVVASGRRGESR